MTRCALYRIWRGADLLYIGISYNPWLRYGNHLARKEWCKTATRMDVQWFDSRADALHAERLAIAAEAPPFNTLDVSGNVARKASGRALPLAEWIAQSGMTQAEFAGVVGLHFTAMSRVLSNQRRPTKDAAALIETVTSGAVPVSVWGFKAAKKTDPAFLEQVTALAAEGLSIKEIAGELGVTYSTATTVFRTLRLPTPPRKPKSKYADRLRELSARGATCTEAARALGIPQCHVSRAARSLGVTFKDGRKVARPEHFARLERIRTLAAKGHNVTQVAAIIGISQPELSRMKKRFGIDFPGAGRRDSVRAAA